MKQCHILFSLSDLTDRPLIFYSMIALLSVALLFFLLVLRQSHKKKLARQAASASDAMQAAHFPEQAAPSPSTMPFPALIELVSPLSGKLSASDREEETAQTEMLVRGCSILPSEGKIYAPCDCTVHSLAEGFHALTLDCSGTAQVTVSIGKGSAQSSEKDFIPCCKAGDKVKEGDLLLSFDLEAFEIAGYEPTATISIDNADRFAEIKVTDERKVSVGENLMTLVPKAQTEAPQ